MPIDGSWLHRFVCELEHVRTISRKALQVQLPTGLGLVHDAGRSVAALLLVPDIPRPQAA